VIQQISGATDNKRLGAYLKKQHKTEDIYVERGQEFYISDRFILVRTLPVAEVKDFFPEKYTMACYTHGVAIPTPTKSSMKNGWDGFQKLRVLAILQATRYLYEEPTAKRTSEFYRKLVTKDATEREILVNRAMLDIFSTDPDGLDDFLLELLDNGRGGMVRISARYGHVAFAMPFNRK